MSSRTILSVALATAFIGLSTSQGGFGGFGGYGNFPSCSQSCMNSWDNNCVWTNSGNGNCFCSNETLVANVNSCVSSSSCSDSDKESIYQKIAQLCTNAGTPVTAAPEATFAVTSNPSWTTDGPWSTGWGGARGPFGGGWGPWGSSGPWTTGAWTNWWGARGCPDTTWSGWTSGDWDTAAPWTAWTGCTATTTATVTYTTTISGSIVTGTTFGVKVAEAQTSAIATITSSPSSSSSSSSLANNERGAVNLQLVFGALGGVLLAMIVIT